MNRNGAKGTICVMVFVAVANCAANANAQAGMNEPVRVAVQRVSASTPGSRPDSSVVRDVRRAIRRVPDLDDSDIHIRVSHGVVTLSGTVPQTWQISRAANAARPVLGVKAVTNRLTARKGDAPASE
ncbi:BON domain-containing protein [Paraburkholderia silvatlantica]|uniref:Osmotically-inducible protein OsmY n=1 Tax=Paraburkholderia silvatlantica TaxID=321895 RepID=A0ABR6FK01_9BURK|nr:BON domain-containing protein [Paraburkholderia silvatlantica]MBB2927723.1 osmotically-inducible protein OsmY [Paraburkholderia silvatlantica]PVY36430.1 BON domain-containing protein [Paraburkholderia silvatlantica]PXW40153.1 BON domain-containing protein [Paraburkholderia silvatlantica]